MWAGLVTFTAVLHALLCCLLACFAPASMSCPILGMPLLTIAAVVALLLLLLPCSCGSQLDAFLSVAHLTAALAAPDISLPLLVVAAAQFALFAGADMALTVHVWRAHYQQRLRQRSRQQQQQLTLSQAGGQTGQTLTGSMTGAGGVLSLPLLIEAAVTAAVRQWHNQLHHVRMLAGSTGSGGHAHSSDDGGSSSSVDGSSRGSALGGAVLDVLVATAVQLVAGHSLLMLYVRFYLVLLAGESSLGHGGGAAQHSSAC